MEITAAAAGMRVRDTKHGFLGTIVEVGNIVRPETVRVRWDFGSEMYVDAEDLEPEVGE